MHRVPMPAQFVEKVEEYNALVPLSTSDGVRLRVFLNMDESVDWNLRNLPFWSVLPFTEHSVRLVHAVATVASFGDWNDPDGPLFCDYVIAGTTPKYVAQVGIPPRPLASESVEARAIRVPVWTWLLLRAQDAPGLNEYPVLTDDFKIKGYTLGLENQRNVLEAITELLKRRVLARASSV